MFEVVLLADIDYLNKSSTAPCCTPTVTQRQEKCSCDRLGQASVHTLTTDSSKYSKRLIAVNLPS